MLRSIMPGIFFRFSLYFNTYFPSSAFRRYCKNIHWVRCETKRSFDVKLYQEYSYQKLSKSDKWFSSYNQECRGYFLGHSILITNRKWHTRRWYTLSDDIKIIDLRWPARLVTTSTVGPTLATAELLVSVSSVHFVWYLLLKYFV